MTKIVGIRFRNVGKIYYFDPKNYKMQVGDHVIVETARGVEFGRVVLGPKEVGEDEVVHPLKEVLRVATQADEDREQQNRIKEKDAFKICQKKIREHGLEMKLIDAEYTFDNNKVLFYFTADGRIDFRQLVKDLAAIFKTRIELRQIGVRDETKILGGIGICGRSLCCHTYLSEFAPVSIKMAKEQNLSLNQTKISGVCGRLMCCLKNEQETYEELNKKLPGIGDTVTLPDGIQGTVQNVNVLRQRVKVVVEVNDEKEIQEFPVNELKFRPRKKKVKVSEYIEIIKNNKPMQRLMIAGAGCKLALSIATNTTVLCMLYGCMMGNYDSLYLPMMILGYAASVPFFLLTVRTSQKKGQKASLVRYVSVALVCYVGVLALLLLWNPSNGMNLVFPSVNVYTILFIICFGVGYGAYYATADMPIPMVADCSDYETYRSGKYIPGIMGTLFSLVDKLVSSLAATVVGIAVGVIGLSNLPTADTPYAPGMNWVVIVLFCLIPMIAWAVTLIAMKGYSLTGDRMKEIQEVNAKRKEAIAEGMSLEEAMEKYK